MKNFLSRKRFDVANSRLASFLFRGSAAQRVAPRLTNTGTDTLAPQPPQPPKEAQEHNLTLYEYEASPWCRLVREQATLLDLNVNIRPCPRESIHLQGAYSSRSRFRPLAHQYLLQLQEQEEEQEENERLSLTFPILVDETIPGQRVILKESYRIVEHLWDNYGKDVIPSSKTAKTENNHKIGRRRRRRRPDQIVNSSKLPFPIRFLLLAGPSYLRIRPHHGLMRFPSLLHCGQQPEGQLLFTGTAKKNKNQNNGDHISFTLYQAEGCPYSRLVREALCCLEIPYLSISCAEGSRDMHKLPGGRASGIPVLVICTEKEGDDTKRNNKEEEILVGYESIVPYLWETYHDQSDTHQPSWFDGLSEAENVGQKGTFGMIAYTAFLRGRRSFVPPIVEE